MTNEYDRIDPSFELSIARAVFKYYADMESIGNNDAHQKHHLQSILTAAMPPPESTFLRNWLSMIKTAFGITENSKKITKALEARRKFEQIVLEEIDARELVRDDCPNINESSRGEEEKEEVNNNNDDDDDDDNNGDDYDNNCVMMMMMMMMMIVGGC
jgi:hypothetical protein